MHKLSCHVNDWEHIGIFHHVFIKTIIFLLLLFPSFQRWVEWRPTGRVSCFSCRTLASWWVGPVFCSSLSLNMNSNSKHTHTHKNVHVTADCGWWYVFCKKVREYISWSFSLGTGSKIYISWINPLSFLICDDLFLYNSYQGVLYLYDVQQTSRRWMSSLHYYYPTCGSIRYNCDTASVTLWNYNVASDNQLI